jgi:hypothetical protein
MTKGAYTLSDITWPVVRLYCPQCHRFAQFQRASLVGARTGLQPSPLDAPPVTSEACVRVPRIRALVSRVELSLGWGIGLELMSPSTVSIISCSFCICEAPNERHVPRAPTSWRNYAVFWGLMRTVIPGSRLQLAQPRDGSSVQQIAKRSRVPTRTRCEGPPRCRGESLRTLAWQLMATVAAQFR